MIGLKMLMYSQIHSAVSPVPALSRTPAATRPRLFQKRVRSDWKLIAYVFVLFVCGCATQMTPETSPPGTVPVTEPAQPEPEVAVTPAPVPKPMPEPDLSAIHITIAAVGDMMLGTDYPENHLPDDDGVGFLKAVTPSLSAADITFGNLEGVLVDGGEPGKKCANPNACYMFRSPSRYVQHYEAAGFDVMSLANNHARDFGEEGRLASMQTLADAGIQHSGLEGDFASMQVNGLRVALMAYAVTRNSNLLLDYEIAAESVAAFAAEHDVVIISFHGGAEGRDVMHLPFAEEEYFGEMRGDVVRFSRMMVDVGADLVLGHGPHVVRAMEVYKDRLIAYSLGNFATYYGISVEGDKGIAPILVTTLDGEGRFIRGKIISTEQIRPAGPSIDPQNKALKLLQELSLEDFGTPGIQFNSDGVIVPKSRDSVVKQQEQAGHS